ncbi:hypothetical protein SDC9_158177 [bioreactor metagenome]|uniref:Uncharacterized protein n=1 Tax=bioreactor metagenome TaxID=1076179 RepID=A0A645FAF1_9ZZZZ
MILHHIAQSAIVVVVSTAFLHAHSFGEGDLNIVDVFVVPQRFENHIRESDSRDVLHHFFAQIMIDTENLVFVKRFTQLCVQRIRRFEIAPERFFDD